ncbi:MAG TPA: YceI family protein [Saprospiraceae bacterium]|nr:YceI family protein [Saprospiraceae bacterium]HMQ83601.1 YceI family protein [Saprospiraceae bacterium]
MKKTVFSIALLTAFSLGVMSFSVPQTDAKKTYSVSTSASKIVWNAYKVTGQHEGNVAVKKGSLEFDNDMLTGGSFEIDMTSITVTDIQGEWAQKLTGHLKSDDFFGVEKYPTAKFVITKVVSRGTPGDYKIIGNITIKETTKEIKFLANVKEEGGKQVATADIKLDRSEYDIRYGSGSFFDNLGDKTIYDEFDLKISLVTE